MLHNVQGEQVDGNIFLRLNATARYTLNQKYSINFHQIPYVNSILILAANYIDLPRTNQEAQQYQL